MTPPWVRQVPVGPTNAFQPTSALRLSWHFRRRRRGVAADPTRRKYQLDRRADGRSWVREHPAERPTLVIRTSPETSGTSRLSSQLRFRRCSVAPMRRGEGPFTTQMTYPSCHRGMAGMGHEERFPRPRLSGRCGFGKRSLLLMIRAFRLLGQVLRRTPRIFPQSEDRPAA
jgi:hypothetical protein